MKGERMRRIDERKTGEGGRERRRKEGRREERAR